MYCSNCGNKLDADSRFCFKCGKSVQSAAEEPTVRNASPNISPAPEPPPKPKPAPVGHAAAPSGSQAPQLNKLKTNPTNPLVFIISGILIAIILLVIAINSSNISLLPQDYLAQGNEALKNNKFQEAISLFEKIGTDSKDYQEAQKQIGYARDMIIQSELSRCDSQKDIRGLDNFIQRHSGTEYEEKARGIRDRLMNYFRARQAEFESKQAEFAQQYTDGRNDVARSNTFNESNSWSADFMKEDNYCFYDWKGTLLTLSTNKGGGSARGRIISGHIVYIIELSSSSPAYQKLANVDTWGDVRFSGVFQVKKNGILEENSITEVGKMLNPEYKVTLTDISVGAGSEKEQNAEAETTDPSSLPHPADTDVNAEQTSDQEITSEVNSVIQQYLTVSSDAGKLESLLSFYDDEVDYFGSGKVHKDFIRKDKKAYFRRWSEIDTKIAGEPKISVQDNGMIIAAFQTSWMVKNSQKRVSGTANNTWKLKKTSNGLKIIDEKQKVTSRNR
jgi:hypothetical protein